jgi:hypothetical protein
MPMNTWITRILLGFAIFSLGFGLGRTVGLRQSPVEPPPAPVAEEGSKVIVYYLHATFRCVTCNSIERQAREVVENQFADQLAAGRVEWRTANFQEREDLAKMYDVASSTVVVVRTESGRETGFQRLDDVWTLHSYPDAFAEYVGKAIRTYLE